MFFFFIILLVRVSSIKAWIIRIEKSYDGKNLEEESVLNLAEVNFFKQGRRISKDLFNFTASSFLSPSNFEDKVSGPPSAANDGKYYTIFHSAYRGANNYEGSCCPDRHPTLTITTSDTTIFDSIEIINRPFMDFEDRDFYSRFNGSIITVYPSSGSESSNFIFQRTVTTSEPSYMFYIHRNESTVTVFVWIVLIFFITFGN